MKCFDSSKRNASWCSKSGNIVVPFVFLEVECHHIWYLLYIWKSYLLLRVTPLNAAGILLQFFCKDTLVSCYVSHLAINVFRMYVFWIIIQSNKAENVWNKQDEALKNKRTVLHTQNRKLPKLKWTKA